MVKFNESSDKLNHYQCFFHTVSATSVQSRSLYLSACFVVVYGVAAAADAEVWMSFTTSTPVWKMLTMQIKQGQLEQHTQSFFLNGILTQLMSLTQGFGPPTVQVKAALRLFGARFE